MKKHPSHPTAFIKISVLSVFVVALSLFILSEQPLVKLTSSQGQDKVMLCHHSGPRIDKWVALDVAAPAAESHLAHGDFAYAGPLDPDGTLVKKVSDQWCSDNFNSSPTPTEVPGDPTPTPIPEPLIELSSTCQANAQEALVRFTNTTPDSLMVKVALNGGSYQYFLTIPANTNGQDGVFFLTLPVGTVVTADAYKFTMDGEVLVHSTEPYTLPAGEICQDIIYCFNGQDVVVYSGGVLQSSSLGPGAAPGTCPAY